MARELAETVKYFEESQPYNLEKSLAEHQHRESRGDLPTKKDLQKIYLVLVFEQTGNLYLEETKGFIALDLRYSKITTLWTTPVIDWEKRNYPFLN